MTISNVSKFMTIKNILSHTLVLMPRTGKIPLKEEEEKEEEE